MYELIKIMENVRDLLKITNEKLERIQGNNYYSNSIYEVCNKLDELRENICDKLNDVQGDRLHYTIEDIYNKLNELESTIEMLR